MGREVTVRGRRVTRGRWVVVAFVVALFVVLKVGAVVGSEMFFENQNKCLLAVQFPKIVVNYST